MGIVCVYVCCCRCFCIFFHFGNVYFCTWTFKNRSVNSCTKFFFISTLNISFAFFLVQTLRSIDLLFLVHYGKQIYSMYMRDFFLLPPDFFWLSQPFNSKYRLIFFHFTRCPLLLPAHQCQSKLIAIAFVVWLISSLVFVPFSKQKNHFISKNVFAYVKSRVCFTNFTTLQINSSPIWLAIPCLKYLHRKPIGYVCSEFKIGFCRPL